MKSSPKLALRREVLAQLEPTELTAVAAAAQTRECGISDTCFSCLTWVSCNPADCGLTRTCA